jgi:hypothetical protein
VQLVDYFPQHQILTNETAIVKTTNGKLKTMTIPCTFTLNGTFVFRIRNFQEAPTEVVVRTVLKFEQKQQKTTKKQQKQ